VFPAPLGNVRKRKHDGSFKNRIIQDLKTNRVNLAVSTHERAVLPRGIDHWVDLAALAQRALGCSGGVVKVLILDFKDAFMSIPLHEEERRFNVAVKSLRLQAQATLSADVGRLQLYVDDPARTLAGTEADVQLNADVVLAWWLTLGLGLSWDKGVFTSGHHQWIGIKYDVVDGTAHMSLPREFLDETAVLLQLFARRGG
ncbi:unnamed protein product, partial [Prorocentrum cordatum]